LGKRVLFKLIVDGSIATDVIETPSVFTRGGPGLLTQVAELPPTLKRILCSELPILFRKPPPKEKVIPGLAPMLTSALLDLVSSFLEGYQDGNVLILGLAQQLGTTVKDMDFGYENAWMAVDVLRLAMADPRVSV
jgi:hypothetical protein